MKNVELGRVIRDAREKEDWPRHELASRLGVPEHTVYLWERGQEPSGWHLIVLIDLLELDKEWVVSSMKETHAATQRARRLAMQNIRRAKEAEAADSTPKRTPAKRPAAKQTTPRRSTSK